MYSIWRDQEARDALTDILRKQGYATYARILQLFDFYYTDDDDVIAYMIPQKAAIVMNEKVRDEDSASVLVRHEILHEYLTHMERQQAFDAAHPELNPPKQGNKLANIAGDFEISNRGYTDKDKMTVRSIMLGDRVLSGLVTEDHNKDWANMTFEEMYEELLKMRKEEQEKIEQMMQQFGDLDPEDLERLADQIEQEIERQEQQEGQQGQEGQEGKEGQGQRQKGDQKDQKDGQGNQQSSSQQGDSKDQQGQQSDTHNGAEGSRSNQQQKLDKAAQAARQAAKELDKLNQKPFDDKKASRVRRDVEARARQIADIFKDAVTQGNLIREVDRNIEKERIARTERAQQRLASSGLSRFKMSLDKFIKNEVLEREEYSYAKLDPVYLDMGYYEPDEVEIDGPIPLINVYQDMSGSFSLYPEKLEGAYRAIDSLRKYVKKGLLKMKLYYVTTSVTPAEDGPVGGGGAEGNKIIEHVQATKPQNVIVITDSDADGCTKKVTVPGSVWILFYDNPAPSLAANLRGRRESRQYMIDYR